MIARQILCAQFMAAFVGCVGGGVLSDLGKHSLVDGDKLSSPYFPIVYPQFNKAEAKERDNGSVGRSPVDIASKLGGLIGKAPTERFGSFFKVLGSR